MLILPYDTIRSIFLYIILSKYDCLHHRSDVLVTPVFYEYIFRIIKLSRIMVSVYAPIEMSSQMFCRESVGLNQLLTCRHQEESKVMHHQLSLRASKAQSTNYKKVVQGAAP